VEKTNNYAAIDINTTRQDFIAWLADYLEGGNIEAYIQQMILDGRHVAQYTIAGGLVCLYLERLAAARLRVIPETFCQTEHLRQRMIDRDEIDEHTRKLLKDLRESFETACRPKRGAQLYEWFDYYHACKRQRIKYTLKDVASDTLLSHDYVRQQHMAYKAERDS
jgi:hypothetical protein